MTLVSYLFLPCSEVCPPRVCTLFSFWLINSSQYHVIVNHVTVFSVLIGNSKVELSDLRVKFEYWYLKKCQWCKIQKEWCTVTVAPTIEHNGGHSRKPEVRPGAREESASPAWLAAPPWMPATQRKCIYGGLTLDVDRHYIGSFTATTHQGKGILTLESNPSRETVLIESVTCVWARSIYLSRGWSVVTNPSRGFSRDWDVTTDHPRPR